MNDDRMRHTQKKPFLHKYNGGIHKNKNNFVGRSLYNRLQYRVHHHAASFAVTAFLIFIFALKQHYVFAGTTNIFTAIGFCFNQFFFYPLSHSLSFFIFSHSEYIPPINVTRLSWLLFICISSFLK